MYGELYKAWKLEKTNSTPQPLPADFYQRVTTFMTSFDDELTSMESKGLPSSLLNKEKQITEQLFEDLKRTRVHKIIDASQNHIPIQTANLIEYEIELDINLKKYALGRESALKNAGGSALDTLTVVRFIQDIPEIVGVDLKIYGPFKKEDVASLPLQNAQALEKQGAARVIEVRLP